MNFESAGFATLVVLALVAYWLLHRHRLAQRWVLLAASVGFYAAIAPAALPVMAVATTANFLLGERLGPERPATRRWLFLGIGIKLVDFKIEFGRLYENDMMRIVLADEISPDSCRLWDIKTQDKLDKDRFRRDMGGLVEAYQEVARRLGIIAEGEKPERSKPKLVKTDLN